MFKSPLASSALTRNQPSIPVLSNEGKTYDFFALAERFFNRNEAPALKIKSITLMCEHFDAISLADEKKDLIAQWYVRLNFCFPEITIHGFDSLPDIHSRIQALQQPVVDALATSGLLLENINAPLGESVFFAAACKGNVVVLKQLYEMGMNPNRKHFQTGTTALHAASDYNQSEVVTWLLSLPEIEVNSPRTDNGCTPLHLAAIRGHTNIVDLLLSDRTININAARTDAPHYATPLDLAAFKGHLPVVRLLSSQPNIDLHCAFVLRKSDKNDEVSDFLLTHYLRLMLENPEQITNHLRRQPAVFQKLSQFKYDLWKKLTAPNTHRECIVNEAMLTESGEVDMSAYATFINGVFFSEEQATHPLRELFSYNSQPSVFFQSIDELIYEFCDAHLNHLASPQHQGGQHG